ncbi:MAG: efflux RND transporter permease subunit [Phenylobacterium sp.]|nr:efflux RND transporter permease subunit [Phenylobacterium sp.]
MSITEVALKRSRFTLFAVAALILAGFGALFGFPATEEPTVPFRAATVEVYLPGAPPDRIEALIAQPLEERIRTLSEVKDIDTTIRPGMAFVSVTLQDKTPAAQVDGVWRALRDRSEDAAAAFPAGAIGPIVNDSWGRVSVMTLALSGKDYTAGQMHEFARKARLRLQSVPGVEQVSLHGVREQQIRVELDPARLAAAGISVEAIGQTLAARNIVASSGEIDVSGRALALQTNGELADAKAVGQVPIPLPQGGTLPLTALGQITEGPQDPPGAAVIKDGRPAIVLGVSMQRGLNVIELADRLETRVEAINAELPAGMKLGLVTDQAQVVEHDLLKVGKIFLETVVIVVGVVVMFLGWRAGLVTGVIVPLTVLGTLVLMRVLGIELHQISIAAVIIALGIFVDNGIVVVEDYQRRLQLGEDRLTAATEAGRTMAGPLLISSLAIILAFVPLVAGVSATSEYMRSLAVVLGITLLLSLLIALTAIALLTKTFVQGHAAHDDNDWVGRLTRWYGGKVRALTRRPLAVCLAMVALLAGAVGLNALLPTGLLAPSARPQLQIPVELPAGVSSRATLALAQAMSQRLSDKAAHPDVASNVVYVGDGGPRFILGLNPPTPAPNRAYAVVNLKPGADIDATLLRLRTDLEARFPQARIEPKRFSLGSSESGLAVFRLVGPDREQLHAGAAAIMAKLHGVPGIIDVRDDAENIAPRLIVDIDHARAQAAGVSVSQIAQILEAVYSGVTVTALRQGELQTPVVLRGQELTRLSPESIGQIPVAQGVSLGQIATVRVADQPGVLHRRNQEPSVTVTARHPDMTAQAITAGVAATPANLGLDERYELELGGEIEAAEEANAGLKLYLPLALLGMAALFLWHFGSLRKTFIVLVSIPFVLIGATLGLMATGQPMNYTATLGLLALGGIIVNNAILLMERVREEIALGVSHPEAAARAAQVRLRPIVMTKLTCILGLVPLFIFGGDLWRPMAAAMIGGLALGTLITLLLIPALYVLLFERLPRTRVWGRFSSQKA